MPTKTLWAIYLFNSIKPHFTSVDFDHGGHPISIPPVPSRNPSLNILHVAQKNIVMDYDPFYNTIDHKCYVFTRVFTVHSKDVSIHGTMTNILLRLIHACETCKHSIKVSLAAQMLAFLASNSLPILCSMNSLEGSASSAL